MGSRLKKSLFIRRMRFYRLVLIGVKIPRKERPIRNRKGFTLVDVMVAVGVSSMALLALLATSVITYKINHKARLRDNTRSVLRSFVDQFQRIGYSDDSSGTNVPRRIFEPTQSPTGQGLRWGELSNEVPNGPLNNTPLEVDIGSPGSPQLAYVTRMVSFVTREQTADSPPVFFGNSSLTGSPPTITRDREPFAAGFMIRAEFTVTYTLTGTTGAPITQRASTLRLID
jgi:type II secretory pathway pseudopilin PulG